MASTVTTLPIMSHTDNIQLPFLSPNDHSDLDSPKLSQSKLIKKDKHISKNTSIIGNYELLQTIGEGSFAKVKIAIHTPTNHKVIYCLSHSKVAIKVIDKSKLPDEYSLKNVHREAQILRILDHPNIIKLFEVMETKKNLFLVLELANGGELLEYIVNNSRLKEDEAKRFTKQIMSALV
ncbi:Map microtubule affinity-regulating kinase [Globomyces sp. JEL0801]|nr:Map microtubule affinity-regulating kinase [Globomyces sp. JEL0801]